MLLDKNDCHNLPATMLSVNFELISELYQTAWTLFKSFSGYKRQKLRDWKISWISVEAFSNVLWIMQFNNVLTEALRANRRQTARTASTSPVWLRGSGVATIYRDVLFFRFISGVFAFIMTGELVDRKWSCGEKGGWDHQIASF